MKTMDTMESISKGGQKVRVGGMNGALILSCDGESQNLLGWDPGTSLVGGPRDWVTFLILGLRGWGIWMLHWMESLGTGCSGGVDGCDDCGEREVMF